MADAVCSMAACETSATHVAPERPVESATGLGLLADGKICAVGHLTRARAAIAMGTIQRNPT